MINTTTLWIVGALASALACSAGDNPVAPAAQSLNSVETRPESNYSFSISPADRSMHVRFLRARSESTESVSAFMTRMFASADSAGVTRLVLDLRSLEGGDSFLLVPLVKGIVARERFTRRGGLELFVGANSLTPRQNATKLLMQYAHPAIRTE
ncbi:MAG: hypothetical protein ACJ785_04025 [Gemmatimonadaceae bacterium]